MLIGYRGRADGRVKVVAGKNWTFKRRDDLAGRPLCCEVDDEAAVAVFLSQHNANLFYALDRPAALKRDTPGGDSAGADKRGAQTRVNQKGGQKSKAKTETPPTSDESNDTKAARLVIENDEASVLAILDNVKDAKVRAEALRLENARAGGARAKVIGKLKA